MVEKPSLVKARESDTATARSDARDNPGPDTDSLMIHDSQIQQLQALTDKTNKHIEF